MHFLLMALVALVVATVVAVVDSEHSDVRGRSLYGAKIFGWFMGVGLVLGWLMYFIPF